MIDRFRRFLADEGRAAGLPLGTLLLVAVVASLGVLRSAENAWHPDEHFQILEFAWARLGLAPVADLPWEFAARIRPTLQPVLAMGALAAFRALGVESPWPWILALRLISLALAFVVMVRVASQVAPELGPAGRRTLWASALLLWFAPMLTARFTSENWSGMALAAAVPLIAREAGRARDARAGVLLGLAFVLRFQAAFAIAALLIWLVTGGRGALARAARISAAAASVVALGVALDSWFYGAFVLTPWEYLRSNLIEGVAATFGTSPWWWYLPFATLWMAPPVGLAIALLVAIGIAARPRSPWAWALVAFAAGHTVIAHKELRFLFPLVYFFPVLMAFGVDRLAARAGAAAWMRPAGRVLAAINVLLLALLLTPWAHRGKELDARYVRFLWEAAEADPDQPLVVLAPHGDPYRFDQLVTHVFRHPVVRGGEYRPGMHAGELNRHRLLVVTRDAQHPSLSGVAAWELVYEAEPGYRAMARPVGLDDLGVFDLMARVDGWDDSEWVRRVWRPR